MCFLVEGADEPREDHGSIHGSYRVKEVSRENRFDFFLAMAICREVFFAQEANGFIDIESTSSQSKW